MNNECKGCVTYDQCKYLINIYPEYEQEMCKVMSKCVCRDCLIKCMCRKPCENFDISELCKIVKL